MEKSQAFVSKLTGFITTAEKELYQLVVDNKDKLPDGFFDEFKRLIEANENNITGNNIRMGYGCEADIKCYVDGVLEKNVESFNAVLKYYTKNFGLKYYPSQFDVHVNGKPVRDWCWYIEPDN